MNIVPWIVIGTKGKSKQGGLRCTRCKLFQLFETPAPLGNLQKQIRGFNIFHENCVSQKMTCTVVLTALTELPEERPLRVGERFTSAAGVVFAVTSFVNMRFRKPSKEGK